MSMHDRRGDSRSETIFLHSGFWILHSGSAACAARGGGAYTSILTFKIKKKIIVIRVLALGLDYLPDLVYDL